MDLDKFNVIPIRQEKKKYATFTVREVSFRELEEWRAKEKMKEEALAMKARARDERIAAFASESGQTLDSPTVGGRSWSEKMDLAKEERARLSKAEEAVVQYPPWVPTPEPKRSFFQKIKDSIVSFWKSANF